MSSGGKLKKRSRISADRLRLVRTMDETECFYYETLFIAVPTTLAPTTTETSTSPTTSTTSSACPSAEYTVAEDVEGLIGEYCMESVRFTSIRNG